MVTHQQVSFMVTHPKWRMLEVGTYCCDNLTCTQAASEHMESLRRHQDRRKRFVQSPRWEVDYAGELSIKQKGIFVSLVKREGAYRIRVRGKLEAAKAVTTWRARRVRRGLVTQGLPSGT